MARWKKGQSGNPNGRPIGVKNRSTREIQELIQDTVDFPSLVKKLEGRALRGNEHASRLLLEYGFGKPHVTGDLMINQREMNDDLRMAAEEAIQDLLRNPTNVRDRAA